MIHSAMNPKRHQMVNLDPNVVGCADVLGRGRFVLSPFNDANLAYAAMPETVAEQAIVRAAAATFVGNDSEDWDALFPPESSTT